MRPLGHTDALIHLSCSDTRSSLSSAEMSGAFGSVLRLSPQAPSSANLSTTCTSASLCPTALIPQLTVTSLRSVFRYFCTARSRGWEEKKLRYGLLAEVVRQGGFVMAVVLRYSAIPGHLTTTVFATCGMSVFTFLGAAILSLPTQLATVYLGSAQSNGTFAGLCEL